ncbi:MAG: hypothetical protein ACYSUT_02955 [Planctomycetota bacterium]|jgi:hypothetical protein
MNNYSERQIEDSLEQLASAEPKRDSVKRVEQQIHQYITGTTQKPISIRSLVYYAVASAAVLLISSGLLYHLEPVETVRIAYQQETAPMLTRANLNAAFKQGDQQGLDTYLEKVESHRQPRAEKTTYHQLLNEI